VLKIVENLWADGVPPRTPPRELTVLPQTPVAGREGDCCPFPGTPPLLSAFDLAPPNEKSWVHPCCGVYTRIHVRVRLSSLRKSTYDNLLAFQSGSLTRKLRRALDRDPIAPILQPAWFPALERRLKVVLALVERCIGANGRSKVLVRE